jgi:hypothetical protein
MQPLIPRDDDHPEDAVRPTESIQLQVLVTCGNTSQTFSRAITTPIFAKLQQNPSRLNKWLHSSLRLTLNSSTITQYDLVLCSCTGAQSISRHCTIPFKIDGHTNKISTIYSD